MHKLLSCALTAAMLTIAVKVSAEPPPAEPVVIATESTVATECIVGGASPLEKRCSRPPK